VFVVFVEVAGGGPVTVALAVGKVGSLAVGVVGLAVVTAWLALLTGPAEVVAAEVEVDSVVAALIESLPPKPVPASVSSKGTRGLQPTSRDASRPEHLATFIARPYHEGLRPRGEFARVDGRR
jgi:hypothetical protein